MTKEKCPGCVSGPNHHPDHSAQLKRLRRIAGQVAGIERMIEARTYCPDIMIQVEAVRAALKGLNAVLLKEHVEHCVREAFASGSPDDVASKTSELVALFKRETD
ncbi:MAG TPA: transcriptional regulator [Rhodospirillaceae bacterium]|nr:MAG: hypothetical protein A2018_01970 [Alphaproteobacteria bacterium GWF2_58_20]HAU29585.1 transcriptional regulator [Rhodospirillaceae bacterium]